MIKIEGLYKEYGNKKVLSNLNLDVKSGEIQAVLGINGTGKSTLVNILAGLLNYQKGNIIIAEEKISVNKYKYKEKTGFLLENPIYVDSLSVVEYLKFVSTLYNLPILTAKNKIEELIEFFDLPKSNQKIRVYSKGMKKKVSLAATLLHNPKVLILDEPFANLDFIATQKLVKYFDNLAKNKCTLLIVSHQFDALSNVCNKFALLKNGKMEFNLNSEELSNLSKRYENSKDPVRTYLENQIL